MKLEPAIKGDLYLVMLIHAMDDMPLRLFADFAMARRFAERVRPMPTDAIAELYGVDSAKPVSVEVLLFVDGVPVDRVYQRLCGD